MILSHSVRRSIAPRFLVPGALLAAAAIALPGLLGHAAAATGHWTPKGQSNWSQGNQERYAVHMMLLRGDNNPYAARILWWQGEAQILPSTQTIFYGGEWGWTPGIDSCATYPTANFVSIGVDTSGMDPFCGSNMILGDGRVLMAGGHNPFIMDYGDNRVRIFKDSTGTNKGTWSVAHDMNYWRWYPTATTLRDSRAVLVSGNQYRQHQIFGGKRSGSAPVKPTGDSLYRFAPIPGGKWDTSILPDPPGDARPSPRYAHSAIATEHVPPFYGQVYFGGHDSTGLRNDTWIQQIYYYDQLRSDPQYVWQQPTIAALNGSPAARSDHSAIVALDTSMVVFGGLDISNSGRNDVWRLFYDSSLQPPSLSWSQIAPTDTTPSPRYGHSAIYDTTIRSSAAGDTLRRMIVFGGTSALDQAPTDSRVWELRFNSGNPNTGTWREMPQDTLGSNGGPSPRYWHTMNVDHNDRVLGTRGTCHVAFMFGGKLDTGACSDTLWKLWILQNGHVGWEKVLPPSSTVPGARARHSAVLDTHQSGHNGRLYVYGGVTANGDPADSHVCVLDPWGGKYSTWTQWSDLGTSLAGQTALLDADQQFARTAEVYDPATDLWTALSSATMRQTSYPPVFLVPGGSNGASRMITINNNSTATYYLDIPATGQSGSWQPLTMGSLDLITQAGVLYRPDRLMVAGGQNLDSTRTTTGKTRTLDASSLSNRWVQSSDMVPRLNPNLVLLPTGNVLAVGGNQGGESGDPIKRPQMWSLVTDSTGVWSSATEAATWLEEQPTIRGYHSTAILLPDGRVLSAGGSDDQADTSSDQHTADIFCPPYLFDSNGVLTARPTFSNSAKPESLGFGKVFTICVPDTAGITRACLIRPGATTHAFDQNQRYVPLNFTTAGSPMRLLATSPASPDSAPPGYYMLFLTGKGSNHDVPSFAKWVRVVAAGLDSCDVVPPQAISDLVFDVDPIDCTLFHLHWAGPGDDSDFVASGPASQYNMKVSTSSISTNWTGGTTLSLAPGTPGTTQTTDVSVGFGQSRYIRLKTKDDNNNWSWISNQIHISGPPLHSVCSEGDGSFAAGGGGGGERVRPGAGPASVQRVGSTWSGENTLLNGVSRGTRAGDLLRLPGCAAAGGSAYSVRIREVAGHAMKLDDARLLTVDHSSSVAVFMASGKPVLGTQVKPAHAIDGTGTDVTALVDGSTSDAFVGDSGAVLTVELRADSAVTPDPVVIEASGLGWFSSGVLLQVPDGANSWRTAAQLHPRLFFDQLSVDSVASARVRLVLLGRHQIRFVGRMTRSSEQPTLQWAELVKAQDGRLGDALSALAASDTASVTLVGPDTLLLSFAAPPLAEGQVRECFLAVDATPLSPLGLPASQLRANSTASMPIRFALWQNQPNPFSAATSIRFDLPVGAMVRLEVFDVQGRRVKVVADHYFPAGYQAVQWDRRTGAGGAVRPGVYLYRLIAGSFRAQKKMVLLP